VSEWNHQQKALGFWLLEAKVGACCLLGFPFNRASDGTGGWDAAWYMCIYQRPFRLCVHIYQVVACAARPVGIAELVQDSG